MTTPQRDIVDLLWNDDQADALGKLKDMLQTKAAMAVDASKQGVADRMFPHVPDEGNAELDKEMKKAQIKSTKEKGTTNPSGSTRTPAKSGNGNK